MPTVDISTVTFQSLIEGFFISYLGNLWDNQGRVGTFQSLIEGFFISYLLRMHRPKSQELSFSPSLRDFLFLTTHLEEYFAKPENVSVPH